MVIVTIPVLLSIIVISMAVILTMIGLYLIWRRRNGQEGNAPEIHTSNITVTVDSPDY